MARFCMLTGKLLFYILIETASVIKSNCEDKKTSGLVSGLSYSRLKEG